MKNKPIFSPHANLKLIILCLFFFSYVLPTQAVLNGSLNTSIYSRGTISLADSQGSSISGVLESYDCPFKGFLSLLSTLQNQGFISDSDVQKVISVLLQIPTKDFNQADNKEQALADTLYQDKILTETQYLKISELLQNAHRNN